MEPWYTFIDFQFYSSWFKTQKLTRNYLNICPDPWQNKKNIVQLATPASIQNDYMKLSGFTFKLDVSRFLYRGNFFNPENFFVDFYDQPYTLLPSPPLNCLLNRTDN